MLCDVVPMHARHVLLGRPWQFNRKVIHDGFKNRYSFVKDNQNITLVPMTPKQVYEEQVRMTKESEKERIKMREKESRVESSKKEETLQKREKWQKEMFSHKRGKKE